MLSLRTVTILSSSNWPSWWGRGGWRTLPRPPPPWQGCWPPPRWSSPCPPPPKWRSPWPGCSAPPQFVFQALSSLYLGSGRQLALLPVPSFGKSFQRTFTFPIWNDIIGPLTSLPPKPPPASRLLFEKKNNFAPKHPWFGLKISYRIGGNLPTLSFAKENLTVSLILWIHIFLPVVFDRLPYTCVLYVSTCFLKGWVFPKDRGPLDHHLLQPGFPKRVKNQFTVQKNSFLYCRRQKFCHVYLGHKTRINDPSTHQFQTLGREIYSWNIWRVCSYTFTFLKNFSYTFTSFEKKCQSSDGSYFKMMFSPLQWSTEVSSGASHVCTGPTRSSGFLKDFSNSKLKICFFFQSDSSWV